MPGETQARLQMLGLTLPPPAAAAGNYVPYAIHQNTLYVSGQLPFGADGSLVCGRLGDTLSVRQGQEAARLAGLNILAQAQAALGDLDRIVQCLRLNGFVNATPDFADHPAVVNGASDLLYEVLGDKGRHTRIAVGAAGLPKNVAVEIDAVFAIA